MGSTPGSVRLAVVDRYGAPRYGAPIGWWGWCKDVSLVVESSMKDALVDRNSGRPLHTPPPYTTGPGRTLYLGTARAPGTVLYLQYRTYSTGGPLHLSPLEVCGGIIYTSHTHHSSFSSFSSGTTSAVSSSRRFRSACDSFSAFCARTLSSYSSGL